MYNIVNTNTNITQGMANEGLYYNDVETDYYYAHIRTYVSVFK